MGKEGFALAVIAALAMAAVAFFVDRPASLQADTGICFPSPDKWGFSPFWGWFLNSVILAAVCVALSSLNKEYRIVRGSDTVLPGMFLIMAASNIWVSGMFTSTGIIALANIACIMILFSCYGKYNATKDLFVIASILSAGSMIEYAFLFMMPVYLIGAIIVKCFDIKALAAYIMGLIAPYWIVVGLGIVPIDSISFPHLSNVFGSFASKGDMLFGFLNVGITAFIGFALAFMNSVRFYTGNSRKRGFNAVINLLGGFILLCMIFDFENLLAYLATGYFITAIQLGNLFEGGNIRKGEWWLLGLSALYAAGFVMMIVKN